MGIRRSLLAHLPEKGEDWLSYGSDRVAPLQNFYKYCSIFTHVFIFLPNHLLLVGKILRALVQFSQGRSGCCKRIKSSLISATKYCLNMLRRQSNQFCRQCYINLRLVWRKAVQQCINMYCAVVPLAMTASCRKINPSTMVLISTHYLNNC